MSAQAERCERERQCRNADKALIPPRKERREENSAELWCRETKGRCDLQNVFVAIAENMNIIT